MVSHDPLKIIHCFGIAGQERADMDLSDRGTGSGMAGYDAEFRCRRLACELESQRERTGGQHRRQQGQLVEGAVEGRVGIGQNDRRSRVMHVIAL